ncbi:DnaJ-like [Parasponia andersonii]|uniref:DnaJ-like n=1 Tax=Parasponia andersonii TaxID=3476 RepID=A0A2P5DE00_PARAD|nr:DnaJ-like [Parasponia andersonii]
MESNADPENQLMIEGSTSLMFRIDPKRQRFPCCIVWTPLPVISWLIPFIGHIGICREGGVILDFAGPNFVSVDNFAFGAVARYIQISKEKCHIFSLPTLYKGEDQHGADEPERGILTWDDALRKSTQEFQHRSYNLFTCNCHSFVANNLNRLRFSTGGWNVVNLAALIFLKGKWVSKASMVRSFLPFLVVVGLGLAFGGSTFLTFLAFFTFFLVEEGQVISCHTVEAWNEQLQRGNDSRKLMVVDFTASWCGPCRFIMPFLTELAKRLPNVVFLKVDVDELKSVAQDWAVEAMPTFVFLKEGSIVDKVVGAKRDELQQTIAKHIATSGASA